MNKLLFVPLKKPSDVDISKPLINLIQSTYCCSTPSLNKFNYSEIVNEFSKQRNTAVWKFFEKRETSLNIVYEYYDQLCALERKIPVNELQIPFKWKDAFDKGSIFGGKISLTHTSLMYEKVCVLFNIAALQSSIAAEQALDSDDGLKLSIKLLQQAAGIFQYLKGAVPAAIPSEVTPDLNQETLTVLCNLMIAQAQEVFVVKAIKDNMKDQIIAKLCCQCEEMYAEVLRGLQKDNLRNLWDKEWISLVAGKQAGFHALTQLYQSLVCRGAKRIGEEIARLRWAIDLFKSAQSRSGIVNFFDEFLNRSKRNLAESTKDNEFIYNEMIPEIVSLSSPEKAQLAKPLPLASPMSATFKDIFAELVPMELHRAIVASETRKNEIVNAEINKLRESTQTLNAVLASLNLPAAVETLDLKSGLPSSLIEKANDVRSRGGVECIDKYLKELPELLNRNREILDETERLLDEERDSDKQLRSQFKERWTRATSESLQDMFRVNLKKYRDVIENAIQVDKIVRQKYEANVKGMKLLSMPPEQIQNVVPTTDDCADPESSSVLRLKSLMESVEVIKAERDAIESDLKSLDINMKEKFLNVLSQNGVIDEPTLTVSEIGQHLGPLQAQIKDSIDRQQALIADIQQAHHNFVEKNGSSSNSRDSLYSELATAYDSFVELLGNLKEGTKFYNDLTELLVVFQNKISDFCFARKTEKEELLKDLTIQTSRQPMATPQLPTHYASTNTTDGREASSDTQSSANVAYPAQVQGMPMPYGANSYQAYIPPPMPTGYNPYATLPYPSNFYQYGSFPQGPQMTQYGTYPGSFSNQQGGLANQQKPPGWWQ